MSSAPNKATADTNRSDAPSNLSDGAVLFGSVFIALACLVFLKLALIAMFITLVAFISRERLRKRWPNLARVALWISVLGSTIGLVRFTLREAIPGILKGGNQAADKYGLSQVRQVVSAEDAMRRGAFMDHDGDGIGSAGRIAELSGLSALRGAARMALPALNYSAAQLVDTKIGPAVQIGAYLLIVCLPTTATNFSASTNTAIDEERAERAYYVYAWPVATGLGVETVYCADQDERIWAYDNHEAGTLHFAGPSFPPDCSSVVDGKLPFEPWMNKQPRKELPGDSTRTGSH
ncbi:MAG TPA: hypothetical protein VL137_12210 [Polyangiaceae bacterium]|jgi:hypothetical protein|nr:hypothetical protein [Polyangiaceae bacterium]